MTRALFRRLGTFVALLLALGVVSSDARAQVIFPNLSIYDALPLRSVFGPIRDITGDMAPDNADLSSRGEFKNLTTGGMDSVGVYSNGSVLFLRWTLSSNPLTWVNSQGTYMVDSRNSYVVLFDTNNDGAQDWAVSVSKGNAIRLFRANFTNPIYDLPFGPISRTGTTGSYVYKDTTGYIRVTELPYGNQDQGPTNPSNLHYLEAQIPLSWFSDITPTSFFRLYFGSSNNDNNINKDYMLPGATAVDFSQVAPINAGNTSLWGAIFDSRDPSPSSTGGVWNAGETVQIQGYGWPNHASVPVQIYTPDGATQVWSGAMTSDGTGNIVPTQSWSIPTDAAGGVYRMYVGYPTDNPFRQYDTFTVLSRGLVAAKSVDKSSATAGAALTYTITYRNASSTDTRDVVVSDAVPFNTTFVRGSAAGTGTTISYSHDGGSTFNTSDVLPVTHVRWNRPLLSAGTPDQTVSFRVTVNAGLPAETILMNTASAGATGINTFNTNTVSTVVDPRVTISKIVDKATAGRGEVLTYTLNYSSVGGSISNYLMTDAIPANTTYVPNSAQGAGLTITYSHNGGISFDSSNAAPVTHIRWTRSSFSGTASASFQVTVNNDAVDRENIINSATNQADAVAMTSSNTVATVVRAPSLTLSKSVDLSAAVQGSTLTYTLTYGNSGSGAATKVILTDAIPMNTTFVTGSALAGGAALSFSHDGGVTFNSSGDAPVTHLRWTLASLAGNITNQTVSFKVKVNRGVARQTALTNVASALAEHLPAISSNNVTTTVQAPVINVTKTVDKPNALPNDVLTYTVQYTNAGDSPAHDIEITSKVPFQSAYVEGSAGGAGASVQYQHTEGGPFDTSITGPITAIKWLISEPIQPGTSGTLTFKVSVR